MHLTVLAVPDCPNAPVLKDRLAAVLGGRAGVSVSHQVISDEDEEPGGACAARPRC